ncbi:MAG: UPF0182 family protein [Gemmatimonadota bacterium]
MTGRRILVGAIVAVALVLLVGRWSASLYADFLWFDALGAREVWQAKVVATGILTLLSFLAASSFAFINLFAVRRSVVSLVLPRRIANIEIGEEVPGKYLVAAVVAMSVVLGAAMTFPGDQWHAALLARIGRSFGELDPYLDEDVGFFVYRLPFEEAVHMWAVAVLVVVSILVILLYALTPSLRWERGSLYVSAYVRRHFTMLGAVLLLVLAWSYRLSMYRLLSFGSGPAGIFTLVDHHALIPATLLLSVVALCAAVVVAWAGWTGQTRLAFFAVSAVLVLSLMSRTIAPLAVRRSVDAADQRRQELSYMSTRLTFTRRAYGVDRMRAESLGTGFANAADVATRLAVWDGGSLGRAAERLRHVRILGDGPAWEATPSGITAALVENGTEGNPESRDVWNISRFDASSADDHGLPLRALPPLVSSEDINGGEPAVYDAAPSYSVLSDSARQLAGVEMVSTRSRLMHAWSLQNFRLLFGDLPANRPVMVQRRDVRERIAAITPFFVQGSEVVPVIASDTLYWIVELYSASVRYPLAQRFTVLGEERGYFQHAATAIVHAPSGHVRIVNGTNPDPVAMSWIGRFPHLFRPSSSVAPALRAALPPITDAARTQALAFAVAGFRGDNLEARHIAALDGADSASSREPSHAMIPSIPGVSAFWPLLDSTDRVRGLVVATGGAARVTSWLPMASDGNRWSAVLDRMRAIDSAVHEPNWVRAPLRVVPADGQPLYVQPTFQSRPGFSPSLARVTVFRADSLHVGPTLATALGAAPNSAGREPGSAPDLRLRADSLYRVMREAMTRGDWTTFGRAFDALGLALRVTPR